MIDILIVFAGLECVLLVGSFLALVWGSVRGWELEILVPVYVAIVGTVFLGVCLLVAVVAHDHLGRLS